MDSLVHPTQLSVWHRFLQARRLHRETSRSKNPDWYRSALQLDCQLHLFVEGSEVVDAHLCDRRESEARWTKVDAPSLRIEEEESGDPLEDYIEGIRKKHFSGRCRSLGVILYMAEEFAISELAPMGEKPEDHRALGERLATNPQEMLEDQSVSTEEHAFRLFPYPGAQQGQHHGAAITISRKHHDFLRRLRTAGEAVNFPIRTAALSAPLVALGSLPRLLSEVPEQPFCIFFSYSTYSVLAFFRAEGELVMLRSVRHHAGGTPPHVGRIIQTMAVALELPEPLVYVLSLSQGRQGEIVAGLPELPNATILEWRETEGFDADIPLECQSTVPAKGSAEESKGLAANLTFREFAEQQWALQDFLPADQDEEELYPGPIEMKALRYASIGFKAGAALLLLFLGWSGIRAFQVLRDPAWHSAGNSVSSKGNDILRGKIQSFEKWDSFLADRSKAWVTMELINGIFTDSKSIMVSEIDHVVRPDVAKTIRAASVVKVWKITGFVKDEGLNQLTALNTREGINEAFKEAYNHTGDESLRADLPTRNLVVNLLASENKGFDPESGENAASQFPFIFSLTITQRLNTEDPLSIPTVTAL